MALRGALEWARRLRAMITGGPGPLTPGHLNAAESAVPTDRLAKAADAWHEACVALLAAFSPQRRPELAAELDDYSGGYHLLEAMFEDPGGREVWHAYQAARVSLAAHGMGAAIDFCIAERIEAGQVPRVIERALLQEWSDYQLRADPALAPLLAAGRDALVDRYQRLDRALAAAGVEITLVDDAAVRRAIGFAYREIGLVLEPSAAIGLAALREGLLEPRSPCVVIATGANIEPDLLDQVLRQ